MYGEVPPRLAMGVTATSAFSSQSVMTLAKADAATPSAIQTPTMMDNIERHNVEVAESVLASVIAGLQANAILRHFQSPSAAPGVTNAAWASRPVPTTPLAHRGAEP